MKEIVLHPEKSGTECTPRSTFHEDGAKTMILGNLGSGIEGLQRLHQTLKQGLLDDAAEISFALDGEETTLKRRISEDKSVVIFVHQSSCISYDEVEFGPRARMIILEEGQAGYYSRIHGIVLIGKKAKVMDSTVSCDLIVGTDATVIGLSSTHGKLIIGEEASFWYAKASGNITLGKKAVYLAEGRSNFSGDIVVEDGVRLDNSVRISGTEPICLSADLDGSLLKGPITNQRQADIAMLLVKLQKEFSSLSRDGNDE